MEKKNFVKKSEKEISWNSKWNSSASKSLRSKFLESKLKFEINFELNKNNSAKIEKASRKVNKNYNYKIPKHSSNKRNELSLDLLNTRRTFIFLFLVQKREQNIYQKIFLACKYYFCHFSGLINYHFNHLQLTHFRRTKNIFNQNS